MRSLVRKVSLRFSHGTDNVKLSCNDYISAHIANFLFLVNWAHRIKMIYHVFARITQQETVRGFVFIILPLAIIR